MSWRVKDCSDDERDRVALAVIDLAKADAFARAEAALVFAIELIRIYEKYSGRTAKFQPFAKTGYVPFLIAAAKPPGFIRNRREGIELARTALDMRSL